MERPIEKECDHKFVFRGLHVQGEETTHTVVPRMTLYEVYFCEKCLEKKKVVVEWGHHIKVPEGASTSGYGFR